MPDKDVRPEPKHPEPWEQDLNPNFMGGVNYNYAGINQQNSTRTAGDIKELTRRYEWMTGEQFQRIPVLNEGTHLKQGAVYLDLHEQQPKEFTARAGMVAGPENWYVPKSEVDYLLWNALTGVDNPERLDYSADQGVTRPEEGL